MARVNFVNKGLSVEVEIGTKLSDAVRKAGLLIETPCNCLGLCGKCKVRATGELVAPDEEEQAFLMGHDNIRLACLAKVAGDVDVELLKPERALKSINRGYAIEVSVDGVIAKEAAQNAMGVAVDIGTTGISAYLIQLSDGRVLDRISCLNPQTQFGGDVLTRISYCISHEKGAEALQQCIVQNINEIILQLVEGKGDQKDIHRLTIAGNTTMLHLFLGINPASLARAPYTPVFLDKKDLSPEETGIHINPNGLVTLLPSASSYVGADILSGVVATGFDKKPHAAIFIDIGTNGEIVAIAEGKMVATSTAAGPALEGMNISCGCRAEEGAIDAFELDPALDMDFTTIDGAEAIGICGSGLIDAAASLVKREIVLKNGKFNSNLNTPLKSRLKDKKFYITEKIFLTQKDIRQIQLAKGAIATGISMLLHEIGISIEKVEEVVIAGAFGYHVNPESIKTIGLIPKGFDGRITFVGNSAVEGARMALINQKMLKRMETLKDEIKVVELSLKEEFQDYFIKELYF